MKLIIRAAGVIRSGPERELIDDYLKRANGLTSRCGFHSVSEQEIETKKLRNRREETERLFQETGLKYIALDERGKHLRSREIAGQFKSWQADRQDICFVIGGADGHDASALPVNITKWSFGAATWPHKLVRVMAAEQIYRALSILAKTPYHRD